MFPQNNTNILPKLQQILQTLKQQLSHVITTHTLQINSLHQIIANKDQQIQQLIQEKCQQCHHKERRQQWSPLMNLNECGDENIVFQCSLIKEQQQQTQILNRTLRPVQLNKVDSNTDLTSRRTYKNKRNSYDVGKQNQRHVQDEKNNIVLKIGKLMRKSISVSTYNLQKKQEYRKKKQENALTCRQRQAFIPMKKINMLKKRWVY